jgi:hypothetical protein
MYLYKVPVCHSCTLRDSFSGIVWIVTFVLMHCIYLVLCAYCTYCVCRHSKGTSYLVSILLYWIKFITTSDHLMNTTVIVWFNLLQSRCFQFMWLSTVRLDVDYILSAYKLVCWGFVSRFTSFFRGYDTDKWCYSLLKWRQNNGLGRMGLTTYSMPYIVMTNRYCSSYIRM